MKYIQVGNLKFSRLIAGSNQISGFSHFSKDLDNEMINYFTTDRVLDYLNNCVDNEINTIVARADAFIVRMIREFRMKYPEKKIYWIAQTAKEYRDLYENIVYAIKNNCDAVCVHGGTTDSLFKEGREEYFKNIVSRIKDEFDMPVGIAAHDSQNHLRVRESGFLNDFHFICMYNVTGYQGKRDSKTVFSERFDHQDRAIALQTLQQINKPCFLYKIFGAGRLNQAQALSDIRKCLSEKDGLLVGMYPKDDASIFAKNRQMVEML